MSTSPAEEATMPFLAHLRELRGCMIRSILAILVTAVLSFTWADYLFVLITAPLQSHFEHAELIGTGPAEAFIVKLKAALVAGVVISSPYWFYQLWRFVAPGLYPNEKKLALPFVAASTFFFILGMSFCFYVLFPFAFQFFQEEFLSIGIKPQIKIGEYLSFAVKLLLVFGFVFELPILSFFLARLRVLHYRWLIDNGRYAILAIFLIAAILTPPDVVTQLLLAGPMLVLYVLCIGIAYLANPATAPKKKQAPPPSVTPPSGSIPRQQ